MVTQVRCPKGHLWGPDEFDDEAGPPDPATPVACPYCGALCTVAADPLSRPHWATSPPPDSSDDSPAQFPGYEVLDVLGRGGMGVVYKARQIRTDRVVALKVPGRLDLETRVRFTTEAQAAARVSHPHIVQVYEVGEHQGRPFLALEYVPGGALADRLTGAPLPPRPAAALAETVARAVGAAHAHGVVHRDLKPANILLSGVRGQGSGVSKDNVLTPDPWPLTPKVTDFGLARRTDTDTGQTRSGMILGTPDYMAPEQAAGDSRGVGPAADVWALGAILYELLVGRRPFRGTGVLETLEQVRTLDPVPPRRLQPAVPRDLEVICLKCLHKDPARRYPAADELADDLRRFLDGLPVRARPVGVAERWVKRARRNPLAAGLAAGLWLVLIAAAGYGVWYHLRLQAQRDRARIHFEMSLRSIEEMLTEVAEEDLAPEPRAELKRKALLEKALRFYDELRRVETDDAELAWLAARAARRVGDIQRQLGRHPEAREAYTEALDRLGLLAATPATGARARREQADCHNFLGEIDRVRGEPALAVPSYQRALAIQLELHAADPDHTGYRQDLSRTRYNLGIVARHTGRLPDALAELNEATRLLDSLPVADAALRHHRARVYLNLGPVYRAAGQLPEADAACNKAVRLLEDLAAEFPLRVEYRFELSAALINHGLVHRDARDPKRAGASVGRAKDLLAGLARDFPATPQYRAELARTYNALAAIAFDARDLTGAAAMSGRAAASWAGLAAAHPDVADYHGELGIALGNQGRALYQSDPAAARKLLTDGLTEVLAGLRASPNEPAFRDSLRQQTRDLAGLLVWAADHDGARRLARDIAGGRPDRVAAAHRAVALLAACVAATERQNPADAAAEVGRYEALAVELVRAAGPADWSALVADADCARLLKLPAFAKALGR